MARPDPGNRPRGNGTSAKSFAIRFAHNLLDDDADQVWSDEIQQRMQDIDEGRVQMIPWSEVRRRVRGQDESTG